jgi:hypothetical protein
VCLATDSPCPCLAAALIGADTRERGIFSLQIPNPRRIRKVRKSMSRIMCVLGERKRMKALIRSQGRDAGSASM